MSELFVIGQSGGPTAVLNASLAGFVDEARRTGESVLGLAHGLEGALNEAFLDLDGLDADSLDRLANTPGAALGSSRRKLDEAGYTRVLENFRRRGVTGFAYCGGNGSMWVAHALSQMAQEMGYDLRVVGIPKTVDNDLAGTDHAPGYGSAARFLALAVRDTGLDLEAMTTFDDVVILETMGRDSGWLAAGAALLKAGGDDAPHRVYVPEIPFDDDRFLEDVTAVHGRLNRVYVVVGEGIRYADGAFVGTEAAPGLTDSMGRTVFSLTSGPAAYLVRLVRERLGLQARFYRPGNIGRALSACVSTADRDEARRAGQAAGAALRRGESGVMAALARKELASGYEVAVTLVPLEQVINRHKPLPRAYMDEAGRMVTPAFVQYALPLIDHVEPVLRLRPLPVEGR